MAEADFPVFPGAPFRPGTEPATTAVAPGAETVTPRASIALLGLLARVDNLELALAAAGGGAPQESSGPGVIALTGVAPADARLIVTAASNMGSLSAGEHTPGATDINNYLISLTETISDLRREIQP